ncbi:thioester-containing protein 1 allele R1-like [Episyrphus balteatus]|uniref:thioester-containing protein 1 allele R1-like n=1 Tax=Episyrphus balteatus TaxID=286459 RepID=UPI0024859F54|nr:thioester-containing protein 1 allele R1-like [Episyrphus balteatus]
MHFNMMTRFCMISIICVLQIAITSVKCSGFYSVIAPGTLRSKSDYHVTASLHDAPSPCKIKVGLIGPEYYVSQTIEIQPRSSKSIRFEVPKIKDGFYNLFAEGISGIEFKNSSRLNYAGEHLSIFIQTDKEIYKPGDEVKYRVLVLDKNMHPVNIQQIGIQIFDGNQNRITHFNSPALIKSATMSTLQLSTSPVLGTWSIEVNADDTVKTKYFKVEKYVQPKFEVLLEAPTNVVISEGKIGVTIESKYTHGKQVKGRALVTVKPSYYYYGDDPDLPHTEKILPFDGKTFVEFDILGDLQITKRNYVPQLTIVAIVEEELTELQHNATATVNIHREKYQIQSVNPPPNKYHPRKPVTFNLVVKNLDGTAVKDTENPLTLSFGPTNDRPEDDPETITTAAPPSRTTTLTTYLDSNGTANFEVNLSDGGSNPYFVRASYLDSTSYVTSLTKVQRANTDKHLKITVQTRNPTLGKDISIKVANGKSIPYFVYTIIGRGDIIQSKIIKFQKNRKYHFFKITPTIEMFPRFTLFVHYVVGNDFHHSEEVIEIQKTFENSISMGVPNQVKPGEEINITVNTRPDSYVALLGVDRSVYQPKTGNGLSKATIFHDLNRYDARTPWSFGYGQYPGRQAGLVTLTNANFVFPRNVPNDSIGNYYEDGSSLESELEPPARKEVPETWIWENEENKNGTGMNFKLKVPEAITSWIVSLVSLNSRTGLALIEEPKTIRVFKPFLVSSNLPYSIKKGEIIAVPVEISNFFADDLEVEVTLQNSDNDFDVIDVVNEIMEEANCTKYISIPSNSTIAITFLINPNKIGDISLNITANSPLASDKIHQILRVEPEGIKINVNKAVFMYLMEYNEKTVNFDIELPENVVPDSESIELSVVGDIVGSFINKFDQQEMMPDGCAEENMVFFVTNVLIINYLKQVHTMFHRDYFENRPTRSYDQDFIDKRTKLLQLGYQRELQFKHDDGSYSAFGKSDPSGSTWLTAFIIRSFLRALPYIDIHPKVIESGLRFLDRKQTFFGDFREDGKPTDSLAKDDTIGLTSFVLLTFLENKEYAKQYEDTIEKGFQYIAAEQANTNDGYTLALATYALGTGTRFKHAEIVITRIINTYELANDDTQWWKRTTDVGHSSYIPSSVDVEMTGYMVKSLLFKGSPKLVLPNIRWLLSQQTEDGRFSSSQGTVVALEALFKFADRSAATEGTIDFEYTDGKDFSGSAKIKLEESEFALKMETHVVPNTVQHLQVTAKGNGSSLAQLTYHYNLAEASIDPWFNITTNIKDSLRDQLALDACLHFIPRYGLKESNMAILEVSLPSGYIADADSFDHIREVHGVQRVGTKNSQSIVIVYFYNLNAKQHCVPINAVKSHAVANLKPTPIVAYDFYDNDKRSVNFYEVKSLLCDLCQGSDCGENCLLKKK